MNSDTLFVYGSFCEGQVHFRHLADHVLDSARGWVAGSVFRLQIGYPVFLKEGMSRVPGYRLHLRRSDALWALLDEFHGHSLTHPESSLYFRDRIEVNLDDGSSEESVIYALNPLKLPGTAQLIVDGDWERSVDQNPVVTALLSDRQKAYIQRLGASSGRDIVPIDLDIYRELINLGIVVDKGRRLALTRLGQDVHRYLS